MFKKATIKIRGVKPLIFHRFRVEALQNTRKEKGSAAGDSPEEWRDTVMCDDKGNLFILPSYIFGCLKNGAKHTKADKGRGNLGSKVGCTLQVLNPEEIWIIDRKLPKSIKELKTEELSRSPKELVYLDICSVKNPTTKARNVRYRIACCPGWQCEFEIMWDPSIISEKQMRNVVTDAGTLEGLADGRSIGNGRFVVESFDVEEIDSPYE